MLSRYVIATAIFVAAGGADAQQTLMQRCTALNGDLTSAIAAEDFQAVKEIARRYLVDCKEDSDADKVGATYGTLAGAQNDLEEAREALETTKTCIRAHYASASCHFQQVVSYVKLNRRKDATTALDRLDKVLDFRIAASEKFLKELPMTPAERGLAQARLTSYKTMQGLSRTIRDRIL